MQKELFVFRIGPLDVGGRPLFWYVTHPDSGRAFFHEDDVSALAEIARLFPDRALACEPSLREAGAPLGYRSQPLTPFQIGARATLWVGAELPDRWRGLDPVAAEYILEYASRLWQRQPGGELVIELEVSARGEAPGLRLEETAYVAWGVGGGIFAFESLAALRAFQQGVLDGDLGRAHAISRVQLEWQRGSPGLDAAMREAYGVEVVPVGSRDRGGEQVSLDRRDAWLLASILVALVSWVEAGSEAAQGRLELTPEVAVDVAVEARFLRALRSVDGQRIAELGWADLARRMPS